MAIELSKAIAQSRPFVRRVLDAISPTPRRDSWKNYVTGAGTWERDKTKHTFMDIIRPLQWGEIESLYYGDWVSARLVHARPDEYFRRGFELEHTDSKGLDKEFKRLGVRTKMQDGTIWARMWGGSALVCGADDGQQMDQPLAVERCRGVKWINVVDRRYLNPVEYYDDPTQENFGQPRNYMVVPAFGQQFGQGTENGSNTLIHESRLIRFEGTKVDPITARRLAGWSYSALQRPYDVIRRIAQTFQAAGQLMYDASQGVLKVSGLFDQLTGPNQSAVLARIAQADMSRWSGKIIAVDKDGEDFTRQPTSFAGIPDIMDRLFLELSGAADAPLTRIFGRSPAGQNATGESDDRMWYESIARDQSNILEPALERILMMLTAGKWDGDIVWGGLQQPDDLKEAQVETERAKKWQIFEDMGAVTGEQVALVEFAKKPIEEVIDEDALQKIVEAEYEMAKAPQPPPAPPLVTGKPITTGNLLSNAQAQGTPPMLPPAKADGKKNEDITAQVREQLQDDYDDSVLEWIDGASWSGPREIPLDEIDFSGQTRWRASKDPDKVADFAKKIKKGILKPVILVKTPNGDTYDVIDGHHRTLAYKLLDRPVVAYVGKVPEDEGPWDEMHASQRSAPSLDARVFLRHIAKKRDHIVERGGKWVLLSKKDPTKVLGTFETKAEAEERERQIIAAQAAKGK